MDELKIQSKFMRSIISKALSKIIEKKLGYKIDISLFFLSAVIVDGQAKLHVNADVSMNVDELKKFTKLIEGEEE